MLYPVPSRCWRTFFARLPCQWVYNIQQTACGCWGCGNGVLLQPPCPLCHLQLWPLICPPSCFSVSLSYPCPGPSLLSSPPLHSSWQIPSLPPQHSLTSSRNAESAGEFPCLSSRCAGCHSNPSLLGGMIGGKTAP